jgi:hypothetical protein
MEESIRRHLIRKTIEEEKLSLFQTIRQENNHPEPGKKLFGLHPIKK